MCGAPERLTAFGARTFLVLSHVNEGFLAISCNLNYGVITITLLYNIRN
jgi:hypothetical protein